MKAFVTGSRVYGTPEKNSDIDLVVYTTAEGIASLRELADVVHALPADRQSDPGPADSPAGVSASLKFGRLNLICVTDLIAYGVWLKGTRELYAREPVDRAEAIRHFRELRTRHGLRLGVG